jgi:ATP-dependent DNA helicase DinG
MGPMPASPRLLLPDAPSLVARHGRAVLLDTEGEIVTLPAAALSGRLAGLPAPYVVHAPATARRIGTPLPQGCLDLLELWAFCLPARGVPPSPRGLAAALGLPEPAEAEDEALLLPRIAARLLQHLADQREEAANRTAAAIAARMGEAGWPWAEAVLAALGAQEVRAERAALEAWRQLPEWEEEAPKPVPPAHPVAPAEARRRLAELLGPGAEPRPSQGDYASAAALAFGPRAGPGEPRLVLAEAGTGTGKTLGYLAPASLWAERNRAPVWIATYTRNLQRQIAREAARLPPAAGRRRVVLRKGRENYLCLLNYEEALAAAAPAQIVPLGLIARWIGATADGDMHGGDFPGWLAELFPAGEIARLPDRRGECLHGACRHWRRCFVEWSIRRAAEADLVVANHALVMVQAALGRAGEDGPALRYVFDEGHHLFDAADSAFAAALTGEEMAQLRRFLLGAEGGRGRARGLEQRLEEILSGRPALLPLLQAALAAARALPAPGWRERVAEAPLLRTAENPAEAFLRAVRTQVLARAPEQEAYALECDVHPVTEAVAAAGEALASALAALESPLRALRERLAALPEEEADSLEPAFRLRIEAVLGSLERRALLPLLAWREMLARLAAPPPEPGVRPAFVEWFELTRREGREADVGMHRRHLDPTEPFARFVLAPAHGVLVTSATLRDPAEPDAETAWQEAEARTGAQHLPVPAIRAAVPSPFDYAAQTRAFVVTDVPPEDPAQVAAAYRELFLAAGGGALGLFTAISRLREAHARLAGPLAEAGIPLYAQHVDAMDNATLVELFRAEERSCLLGTDAMRDGVDVPGRSLRLLVFDRVPWPRPTILHRERRLYLSGGRPKDYDDRVIRHRLRQAFGRLIRSATDRGVFVLLDRRCRGRLLAGLPDGVPVRWVGLAEAVAEVRAFLAEAGTTPAAGSA